MSKSDFVDHDFEIIVTDVPEVLAWAEENIPGRVKRANAYARQDGRYVLRLLVRGGAQAAGLKIVWHNAG